MARSWSPILIGERVNNYQIISLLGEGGMGAVYLAEHPFMGRKAAVKVLRREFAEDAGLVERFMNEARAANAIRHPNIIDIIDVGRLPSGIPYLMMEYLDGQSLAARIAVDHTMRIDAALNVGVQTASALRAAHAKGIVHRDLKPDNLFLISDDDGNQTRVKVLDFGIAKLRGELTGSGAKTQAGAIMGTPPYMSPEQCRGVSEEIDHRTDIYSLGIILYEMLSGSPPFMSEGWGDVVLMHITQPPSPLRTKNQEVSPELEAIVMKALQKRPSDRWGSMEEVEAALRGAGSAAIDYQSQKSQITLTGTGRASSPGGGRQEIPVVTSTTLRAATGQVGVGASDGDGDAHDAVLARPIWKRPAVLGIGALAAVAVVAAVVLGGGKQAAAPVAPVGAQPAAAAPPSAATPPIVAPPAAVAPPPAVAPPAAAIAEPPKEAKAPARVESGPAAKPPSDSVAAAKPTPVAKGSHSKKAGHHAEPRAESAPAAHGKSGCDPNFYFDAQGEKHFKPECF